MTKYATLKKYQPYIDAIRKDLGIKEDVYINIVFANLTSRRRGDAMYNSDRYSKVRVSKFLSHNDTIRVLMHELRHIWQYSSGTMEAKCISSGRKMVWKKVWQNQEFEDYSSRTGKFYQKYLASPWEVDARAYADKIFTLFPGGKVQSRKLVGVVGKVKFYKMSA